MLKSASTALATAIGVAGSVAYFSPWLWRQYLTNRVREHVTANRILALTYDDGPSAPLPHSYSICCSRERPRPRSSCLAATPSAIRRLLTVLCAKATMWAAIPINICTRGSRYPWEAVADIDAGYDRLSHWIQPDAMFRRPMENLPYPRISPSSAGVPRSGGGPSIPAIRTTSCLPRARSRKGCGRRAAALC